MKIILFIHIFFVLSISFVYGNSSEEDICFNVLNEQIKKDSRFSQYSAILKNKDLTEVLFDESRGSYLDLSSYENFTQYLAKNPVHTKSRENFGLTETDFLSRRNNIATVIANDNYIVSQIVGFWRNSNFDFPVESKSKPFWDKYKLNGIFFKEFVLYTHHAITGDFLSCWLFHLTPLNERTYSEVSETGYFTNTLQWNESQSILWNRKCSSGFEGEYINKKWEKFYSMKTNVCALDYAQKDFVRMEILAVAYDNKSDYFNEYVVFPLQVSAMRDTDTTTKWLLAIEEKFTDYLYSRTCLSLIHKNKSSLPSACQGDYGSHLLSYSYPWKLNKLLSYIHNFIPQTFAARNFNFSQADIESSQGMVMFDSFPYELYKKLESIKNPTFVEYIKLALSPNLEEYIFYRKENNIVISPYEETFLSCWLSYQERQDIIVDFLEKIDNVSTFDPTNITYKNTKFWDCIVPYPDQRNIGKVVEGSFPSNQILAQIVSWEYEAPEASESILQMIEEQNILQVDFQNKLDELTRQYNEGKILWDEFEQKVNNLRNILTNDLEKLQQKYAGDIIQDGARTLDTAGLHFNNSSQSKMNNYILILIFLILWGMFIFFAISKNKK